MAEYSNGGYDSGQYWAGDGGYAAWQYDPSAQYQMWPQGQYDQGFNGMPGQGEGDAAAGDGVEGSPGNNEEAKGDSKGRGKRSRGKGGGKRGGKRGNNDGSFGEGGGQCGQTEFMFYTGAFMGEWIDSLGHTVTVKQGSDRRGPLSAKLVRGDTERILSLRRAPESGMWSCGNAVLDVFSSGPTCLVWASPDGRHSTWRKQDDNEDGSPPDLLPWLLHAGARSKPGDAGEEKTGAAGTEEAKIETPVAAEDDEEKEFMRTDGARVSALLDARQVLGADRTSQEVLSHLLTDHDLLRREDEDLMVPAIDSPLWERLPENPRRNVLYRLSGFNAATSTKVPVELADRDANMVHVGRHQFFVASTDVQALRRRWKGPDNDVPHRNALMVHVVALYRTLETPLTSDWQRSSLQLGWDPVDRKRAGIDYELFASPFNASVDNGKYGSRWPHLEKWFGSAGSYPSVIDIFPESASVGVNPPFTDAYLDHVMTNTLGRLVDRFKKVHLFVPVRDAPWRPQLKRLKGACFVRQFWDSTALKSRPMGNPVMYWAGSKLDDL